MAKKTEKKSVVLEMTTPMEVALKHLQDGEITMDQFTEWDAAVKRSLAAKSAPKKGKGGGGEKECEIGRGEFFANAKPLVVSIDGHTIELSPRQFNKGPDDHGSFGWFFSGKVPVKVGKKEVRIQVGLNATVVNSKHQKD